MTEKALWLKIKILTFYGERKIIFLVKRFVIFPECFFINVREKITDSLFRDKNNLTPIIIIVNNSRR
jgi:ATP/ADP translocase